MLCRPKSFSPIFTEFRWNSLRFGRKPSYFLDKEEEREERRKVKEGEEGRFYLHKSRGQHILTNPRVLDTIVRKAQISPTDTVLEIGPGTGNLTLKLLEVAHKVVAVEIDKRMVEILHNRVAERGLTDRLTVICGDALKTEFPEFNICVANIPYGISSPLVAKLLFGANAFRSATLLLQKEFARRLLANPGESEFNRLAVNVKLLATVEFVMDVSKRDFFPCPKVDSSLVRIQPKPQSPDVDLYEWWAFTRTCFGQKNKTLGGIFKQKRKVLELLTRSKRKGKGRENGNGDDERHEVEDEDENENDEDVEENVGAVSEMSLFKEKIVSVLKESGFEAKRPSKLCIEELLYLLSLFNQAGIRFHL
ncbi:ribosomal RNA adenine dimethylase family protein [Tasmannia lanceolata]|uniref:ribosomal RNA adenine dimethylase family protein n=1 Tax=Tasmannia lanceolata TaxID=3420 RepID=UPI0040645F2B